MSDKELSPTLTEQEREEIEKKAIELASKHNVSKVHYYVHVAHDRDNERIVAYVTEPNYLTKIALMDKARTIGLNMAADELRLICQLREESHPLTYGEHSECDKYKLGVSQMCIGVIDIALDMIKKN